MEDNVPQPTPGEFYDQVLDLLRQYHGGPEPPIPLEDMLIVREGLENEPNPAPTRIWHEARRVVKREMDALRVQGLAQAMELLTLRFFENWTADRVAHKRGETSRDMIYQEQRKAVAALADALWSREIALRRALARQHEIHLPGLGTSQLFGVEETRTRLRALLLQPGEPRFLAVDGIGGIGKTTLVNAATRSLLMEPFYREVVWISARQEEWSPGAGFRATNRPALTLDHLVEELSERLHLDSPRYQPFNQRAGKLRSLLQERACLVIVDNLETAADHRAIAPGIQEFVAGNSKFVITSRFSLREHPNVYSISLDELPEADALALLRYEARSRGILDLAGAPDEALRPVYAVVGGNPLALKLVAGQSSVLPLEQVLQSLKGAEGKRAEELYRYVYWHAWQQLDDDTRDVLVRMPVFSQAGATLEQIQSVNDIQGARLFDALQVLTTLSLVNVSGDYQERRYSIHRLTESFLMQDVLNWSAGGESRG